MRIILAAILMAAIATPAAAHYSRKTDNNITVKRVHRGAHTYAYIPVSPRYSRPKDVYVDGNYAGTDPDWRVRYELRREYISDAANGSDKHHDRHH